MQFARNRYIVRAVSIASIALILFLSAPPFPAPHVVTFVEGMKSDLGAFESLDSAKQEMVLNTPAGKVTYKISGAQWVGGDGKPMGQVSSLAPGQKLRVYYQVGSAGASAVEIDLQ